MRRGKSHKRLCIIIPAYNEAEVIGRVLDEIPLALTVAGHEVDVTTLVVNDNSSDDTRQVVAARPHVQLVNHLVQHGAGGATRTGMRYARTHGFDFAVTMDADGQHAFKDVRKVVGAIVDNKADFIIGSRLKDTAGMPWHRVLGNRGLNVITFMLFGVKVSDVQSGLRAFNKKALQKIHFHSSDFAFCPEMIWMAHLQKLSIAEIPIKAIYTDYSLNKGQLGQSDVTAGIRVVRQLLKQRFMRLINE